jgi:galactokinase
MTRESTSLWQHVAAGFEERFGWPPAGVAQAPGRINLIGEHLDYNEGLVLPMAIDRSVYVAVGRRHDDLLRAWSLDFEEESRFSLGRPIARDNASGWDNYVRGVAWALAADGHRGPGLNLAIAGDVPQDAGLSSSAALEVAVAGAFDAAWCLDLPRKEIALLALRAESQFVGVQCGPMDQLASVLSRAGEALLIDCRTLNCEPIPLPFDQLGYAVVVADSGVPRRLAESAFNKRREECRAAAAWLAAAMPDSGTRGLRDVSMGELTNNEGMMPMSCFEGHGTS